MAKRNWWAVPRQNSWQVQTAEETPQRICTVNTRLVDQEQVARLIAAAGDMLDAIGPAITALAFEQEQALERRDEIAFAQLTRAKAGLITAHIKATGHYMTPAEEDAAVATAFKAPALEQSPSHP